MGLAGNLAKKAAIATAKKAGSSAKKAVQNRNPNFCPTSRNGRHRYGTEQINGHNVTYCQNSNCGVIH